MKALDMLCLNISKTFLLPINLASQVEVEKAFGTPLEIQLWHKVTSHEAFRQPDQEHLMGQFYIELNEMSKILNTRIK